MLTWQPKNEYFENKINSELNNINFDNNDENNLIELNKNEDDESNKSKDLQDLLMNCEEYESEEQIDEQKEQKEKENDNNVSEENQKSISININNKTEINEKYFNFNAFEIHILVMMNKIANITVMRLIIYLIKNIMRLFNIVHEAKIKV